MTPHLFTSEGESCLAAVLAQRPLLAFDFDGTLAPIVARPGDARLSRAVSQRLHWLGQRLPVAIVSGRSVADLRTRLDFEPRYLVGNHGAEDGSAAVPAAALDALRAQLQRHGAALARLGVVVEDKQLSLALHYRLSRQREAALACIQELLAPLAGTLQVFGGKQVVNVAAAGAPDKAAAVRALLRHCGAASALFAGDDVNDEPVFAAAQPGWLTVRVGTEAGPTQAQFRIDGPHEMAMLLERMRALLGRPPRAEGR